MKTTRFEDIESWKASRPLVGMAYQATRSGKFADDRDLVRQMRRAASSGMSDVAEGFESGSGFEFRRFLRMSRRSRSELQSHCYVALDQKYIRREAFDELYSNAARVRALMGGFIKCLTRARRS